MKKKVLCVFLSFVILLSVSTIAYAYENYIGSAKLFVYGSILAAVNDHFVYDLISFGYNTGEFLDNSASDVYSVMPTTDIIVHFGNGGPGYVYCVDDDDVTSIICGDTNNASYDYPEIDRAISTMPYYSNKTNILTMYMSSRAGLTPDPIADSSQLTGYVYPSNLVTESVARYAQCAVGWQTNLSESSKIEWLNLFTSYCENYSVSESIEYATLDLGYTDYSSWEEAYSRCVVRGNGSVMINQ